MTYEKYTARSLYKNGWSKQLYLHHEPLGLFSAPQAAPVTTGENKS